MICFLAKFFIKDYKRVEDPVVRQRYGILSGVFGIALNIILVIIKIMAGLISGSLAIFSDALNNLSDVASSLVTVIGFKLSGAEADEEHPFGHGRLEYVAGLIVSLFIIIMGVELLQSSAKRIFTPEEVLFNGTIGVILVISIIIKLIMFGANIQASTAIESPTLKSTAIDSLSDVLSTSIVLVSVFVSHFTSFNVDGFGGLIVGLFVVKAGIDAAKDTINPLLGEPPSKAFIKDIEETVLCHEGILGVHDIVVHNYGPSRIMMSLHVEVPDYKNIVEVHDSVDHIEKELRTKYHCTAVIHVDPVNDSDRKTRELKQWLRLCLEDIDPKLKFHDCRIVKDEDGERVAFDLEVPYKYHVKDEELLGLLQDEMKEYAPEYALDITIDKAEKE